MSELSNLLQSGLTLIGAVLCIAGTVGIAFRVLRYLFGLAGPGKKHQDSWANAEAKARALLKERLTFWQLDELNTAGRLSHQSQLFDGVVYQIPQKTGQIIAKKHGTQIGSICIGPSGRRIPPSDEVLARKLLLEADEAYVLRTGNLSGDLANMAKSIKAA